jgi:hypothetical protein
VDINVVIRYLGSYGETTTVPVASVAGKFGHPNIGPRRSRLGQNVYREGPSAREAADFSCRTIEETELTSCSQLPFYLRCALRWTGAISSLSPTPDSDVS